MLNSPCSVCNGMQTAITLQLDQVTKLYACGMSKVATVSGFSLVIGVWSYHWQCLLMVDIWHQVMKMEQSWCGISQVDVVLLLWLDTPPVYGHLLLGREGLSVIELNLFSVYFQRCTQVWSSWKMIDISSLFVLFQWWRFTSCIWLCWLHCEIMGCNHKHKSATERREVSLT